MTPVTYETLCKLSTQVPGSDMETAHKIHLAALKYSNINAPDSGKTSELIFKNNSVIKDTGPGVGWGQTLNSQWHAGRLRKTLEETFQMVKDLISYSNQKEEFYQKTVLVATVIVKEGEAKIDRLEKKFAEATTTIADLVTQKNDIVRENERLQQVVQESTNKYQVVSSERDDLQGELREQRRRESHHLQRQSQLSDYSRRVTVLAVAMGCLATVAAIYVSYQTLQNHSYWVLL